MTPRSAAALASKDNVFVILGNQLFPPQYLDEYKDVPVFMAEDHGLCTYVRHHKQKIVMFLAAMRSYRDELVKRGYTVQYHRLDDSNGRIKRTKYEDKLKDFVASRNATGLVMWEIEDKFFEERIRKFARTRRLSLHFLQSPMFLTDRDTFHEWVADNRPFMAEFYKMQRRRLNILLEDDDSPRGGRWSFDDENRQSLPVSETIPDTPRAGVTDHVRALIPLVNELFASHPGQLSESDWWIPTTRQSALAWIRKFIDERFEKFGPYEDALSTRAPFLFHSALTPPLNIGLITPEDILDRVLEHAESNRVPLNSLEGFVRQIIGWREFIRGVYREYSDKQETSNFFGHSRKLTAAWYDGTTGLVPLDDAIRKADRFGWTHHIERLMVVGNLMNLCGIDPHEAHRWFMEMFVDSSDWVMGPNVYGMALFSDGGIFATKPYICGSNYILKMSDYKKPKAAADGGPTWCDVMDGLYWRFISEHRKFFSTQPRLARMVHTLDRLDKSRRSRIITAANDFISRVTTD